MEALFLKILNMSITATYVFIAVLILRLLLRRAPKWISYSLWSLMLFRLVCPISFTSTFSFFGKIGKNISVNNSIEHIPADIGMMITPQVNIGPARVNTVINNILPAATPMDSVNPMQIFIFIGTCIWLTGIAIMLIYNTAAYLRLKYRMREATLLSDNVYETDKIASPFVCGLIKPKIYLPVDLQKHELKYVLCHEQTHIERKDHLIKFLAFLALSVHWFNPFVWLAFILMSRDLEMSCDERVICRLDSEGKAGYSAALIHLAIKCSALAGSPLAFGESGIKGRVKNVLNYRKPAVWLVAASVILAIAIGISCLANPADDKEPDLSLLNYKNLSTMAYQMDELLVSQAPGISESFNISARVVAEYLDSADWIIKDVELPPESMADIKIEWNENQDLQFYNSEQFLAMTRINVQRRYYAISRDDYEKMLSLLNQAAGPQNEMMQEGGQDGKLEPASPNILLGQEIGVDMVELDYASDDIVIFHDYFGLFVYDLNNRQIVQSLDLKSIECSATQGDNYCEVTVSANGNTVQLHPMSSKNMYVYSVSNNTLQEMAYERMENRFATFVDIVDVIDYQKAGNYSHTAVKFDNGEYGYLHTSDWTVGTLSYIRGDMVYRLFENANLY